MLNKAPEKQKGGRNLPGTGFALLAAFPEFVSDFKLLSQEAKSS